MIKGVLGRLGLASAGGPPTRRSVEEACGPVDQDLMETIERVHGFTMTSPQRLCALWDAVQYVERARIPGAIVECGSWRGGSMMAAALALRSLGASRPIYLFDTFEGVPSAGPHDVDWQGLAPEAYPPGAAYAVDPEEVHANMASTGYDPANVHIVRGRVEETIPARAPAGIAVLRLDTDLYASTRHELEHLYPRIADGGVLIVDDYGHWRGARKATDEFLATLDVPPLLMRIDYTARAAVIRHSAPR